MKFTILFLLCLTFLLSSCSLFARPTEVVNPTAATPESETVVTETAIPTAILLTPTATMPVTDTPILPADTPNPSFEGVPAFYGPLSLVIPTGLASGMSATQFPRNEGEGVAPWDVTPGHTEFKLEGYLLQEKFHQPKIYVYPAQAFAEQNPNVFENIRRLVNLQADPSTQLSSENLPTIPFFNAGQIFASNMQPIAFQNGQGVRFLTQYAQYFAPVNNTELFYQFQGLTTDGAYYVIAILPVISPVLAETSDPGAVLPPGGVPFPDINDPNADFQGYYTAVSGLLNASPAEAFAPVLSQMDALIQSMKITP
jgi:hypothetical protein